MHPHAAGVLVLGAAMQQLASASRTSRRSRSPCHRSRAEVLRSALPRPAVCSSRSHSRALSALGESGRRSRRVYRIRTHPPTPPGPRWSYAGSPWWVRQPRPPLPSPPARLRAPGHGPRASSRSRRAPALRRVHAIRHTQYAMRRNTQYAALGAAWLGTGARGGARTGGWGRGGGGGGSLFIGGARGLAGARRWLSFRSSRREKQALALAGF
jgi:hypothetical protein